MDKLRYRFENREEPIEKTIASYDQHAEEFFEKHGGYEPVESLLQFQRYVPGDSYVLDAGCGLGRDTDYLRIHGYKKTIGLDMSLGMLQVGSKLAGFQFPAIQGDFRELPFASQSFDGIWAVASIIHIPTTEVGYVLDEFKRILKPGGYVYISVIQGKGDEQIESLKGVDDIFNRGWRYFVYYRQEEIKTVLMEAGLKNIASWERPGKRPKKPNEKFRERIWIHIIAKT